MRTFAEIVLTIGVILAVWPGRGAQIGAPAETEQDTARRLVAGRIG